VGGASTSNGVRLQTQMQKSGDMEFDNEVDNNGDGQ
jgi:hypothetical protein